MRKVPGRKQAVAWTLAGAVTGGLALYGAVWLGRRLVAAPGVSRVLHFIRLIVSQTTSASDQPPGAETVFQADLGAGHGPGWAPPRASNLYGPN